jgi:hypothetical protein
MHELSLDRFLWMVLYSELSVMAIGVAIWYCAPVALRLLTNQPLTAIDKLVVGMVTIGVASAMNSAIWLPGHYFQGTGQHQEAAEWGSLIAPFALVITAGHIIGYSLHVYFAWTRQTRGLILTYLVGSHIGLVGVWFLIGGFSVVVK